jgi:hypothetical protein
LSLLEFALSEQLYLAWIQEAVLGFLRDCDDAVIFGAQAVNVYVDEPRLTQDIDLMSPRAAELAEELREYLNKRFHIAVKVREIGQGRGYRLSQVQKSGNRHLVNLRTVEKLPSAPRIAHVLAMALAELIASKVISYHHRRGKPKSGTDWRDLAMLLLTFPDLKSDPGPVRNLLLAAGVETAVLEVWRELVRQEIQPADEDDEFISPQVEASGSRQQAFAFRNLLLCQQAADPSITDAARSPDWRRAGILS